MSNRLNMLEQMLRDSIYSSWNYRTEFEDEDEVFKSAVEEMCEAMAAFGRRKPKRGFFDE